MAQESLLRHIFKRGLLSTKLKKAAHHTDNENDPSSSTGPSGDAKRTASSDSAKAQGAGFSIKVEAQGAPSTNSCSSSCSSSTETLHTADIPMPIAQRAFSPATISVRDLLHAVIEEANAATSMHMETLDTTLALLNAIQGLSATVDILTREMQEKKEVCEEMKRGLLSFEEVVREMGMVE